MSIKVTHQREQNLAHSGSFYKKEMEGGSIADSLMYAPPTKRLFREPVCFDSPSKSAEIFLPTEIDKLKKLFPLLDPIVNSISLSYVLTIATGRGTKGLRPKVR